jgi:hypothetical protein
MDVENPKLAVAHVSEAVTRSYRYGQPRSGAGPDDVLSNRELSFAFEHKKRINVIRMCVCIHAESRPEAFIDYLEFGQLGEHPVVVRATGDLLSFVGRDVKAGDRASIANA